MKKLVFLLSPISSLLSPTIALAAGITNVAVPGGNGGDQGKQFAVTVGTLWQTIVIVGGLAFMMYFLWGAVNWILSGGEKGKLEEAKNHITQGLIGLAILVASYVIIKFLQGALGIDLLNINWPTAG